jgi:hypothetical protein
MDYAQPEEHAEAMPGAFQHLVEIADRLHSQLDRLEKRLDPVLRMDEEKSSSPQTMPIPVQPSKIQNQADRLATGLNRLDYLTDRIVL